MHDQKFFHDSEPKDIHRLHRRRRFLLSFLKVFLVVFAGWSVLLFLAIGQLAAAGFDLRDRIKDITVHTNALEFILAEQDLVKAQRALTELERALFFLRKVWFFPGLDRQIDGLQGVFISGRQLVDSLSSLFNLGRDILQLANFDPQIPGHTSFSDLAPATKRSVLERLSTASGDFDLLSARIKIATEELELLRYNRFVAPLLGVLDPFIARLQTVELELGTASMLSHLLPELAGLGNDRTHLLLFLNNDELRPGGGFIGTYGLLNVRDGEVVSIATKDVYALDDAVADKWTLEPPAALRNYNASSVWFFRDSNWSPDFSVSARKAIEIFKKESELLPPGSQIPSSSQVDSVIGFTSTAVSDLLKYVGPITAAGQTFTSQNVAELIEYQVEKGFYEQGIPVAQRKEILSELVSQIQEKLIALSFSRWTDIFALLSESAKSKHIAVYSENFSVQQALERSGWAGIIRPQTADFQLFVDANLASLKTDPTVDRSLRYELFRNESGNWVGRTTMTYDHRGSFDWRTTRYRTFVRLFVPQGTTLIRTQGLKEMTKTNMDLDATVFSGFAVIEPGQKHSVVFEYQLSNQAVEAIADGQYSLTFYKQMGARDFALTLDLDFDKNVTDATPAENRNEWGDDRYRLNTKLSQNVEVGVRL